MDVHAARHRARRQVRRPSLTHLPIISRRVVVAPAWEKIPQPRRRRVGLKDLRSVGFARADETRDAVDGDGLCGEAAHHEALHRPHPVSTTRRARDYEYNSHAALPRNGKQQRSIDLVCFRHKLSELCLRIWTFSYTRRMFIHQTRVIHTTKVLQVNNRT